MCILSSRDRNISHCPQYSTGYSEPVWLISSFPHLSREVVLPKFNSVACKINKAELFCGLIHKQAAALNTPTHTGEVPIFAMPPRKA